MPSYCSVTLRGAAVSIEDCRLPDLLLLLRLLRPSPRRPDPCYPAAAVLCSPSLSLSLSLQPLFFLVLIVGARMPIPVTPRINKIYLDALGGGKKR